MIAKKHAIRGQRIEIGGVRGRMAEATQSIATPLVCGDKKNFPLAHGSCLRLIARKWRNVTPQPHVNRNASRHCF
jgi:hypothetical protein